LTPFGQSSKAVLFENDPAVEMSLLVEVIVDRSIGGSEFLQGLYVPELCHRTFPSSERLVRIFGPIVGPAAARLTVHDTDGSHCCAVRTQPVSHDAPWSAIALHRPFQEIQGGPAIPALRREYFEYLSFVIDRTPEIMRLAVDPDEHLIQVPTPSRKRPMVNASFPDLRGEHRT
jgi:hypothetical protein